MLLLPLMQGKQLFAIKRLVNIRGRQKTPPELSEQFPYIRELLKSYGIHHYELENYEADDIIGTLSLQGEKDGFEVVVISGDKDLTQLSSDKTTVYITRKGITDMESYTPDHIQEKYGLTPDRIIDMKGLMGDSSDNIPGVPGVGEKTAIKLLKEFDSLENLVQSIDKVSGKKLKEKLEEFKDQALMSKELATIFREAPLTITLEDTEFPGMQIEKLKEIFKELGFNSLLEKLGDAPEKEELVLEDIEFKTVENITDDIFSDRNIMYVEVLEDNYHYAPILGISLLNDNGAYFLPIDHALKSSAFKNWAEDEKKEKIVYDAKRSEVSLRHQGIHLKGITFDILIAAYLADPSATIEDVASVAKKYDFTNLQSDEVFYGKGAKERFPNKKY